MWALVNSAEHTPVLREVAAPEPAANEALIEPLAFSVNRGELTLLANRDEGWRPGQDVAGIVRREAADGSGPAAGTRVVALLEGAGWAELAAAPTGRIAELPDAVSLADAATLPIAGLTALRTLRHGGDLRDRAVLITGASGAVGRFQVELAARAGARITAVAGQAQAAELRDLGAAEVVAEPVAASGPFDLIAESVGGDFLSQAIGVSAPGATIVLLGASSGERTSVSLFDFFGHEGARLQTFMSYASGEPFGPDLALLAGEVAAGRLHPHIARRVDWSETDGVLREFADRRLHGKVVLTRNATG